MKHYRATPVRGTPGDPIVARGLPALVALARDKFGLQATYESVRAKIYGGDERKLFRGAWEDALGDYQWVEITHDVEADAAYEAEQTDRVVNEDRGQPYMADVYVTVHEDGKDWVEYKWPRIRANGLAALIAEASRLVAYELKTAPPMMNDDVIRMRLPNLRSQMSKSRAAGKPVYSIAFPNVKEGHWKAPNNWLVRVYVDVASVYEEPAKVRFEFARREKDEA